MARKIVLGTILLVALCIRVFFAITCEAKVDYSDMEIYNNAALAGGVSSYPPPGYPLFLRSIYAVFGSCNYKAVFVIQAILSTLVVFLVYYIGRRVCGKIAGWSAAAMTAVYPNLIIYNLTTLTESVSVALVMSILAVAVSSLGDRKKSIIAAIILATGYFVKPSILFFFPGLLVGMKKRFVLVATLSAILVPLFIVGNLTGTGEGRGPRALYKAYNPMATETSKYNVAKTELGSGAPAREYVLGTLDFISSNKWFTLDLIYRKAGLMISRGWDDFVLKDIVQNNSFATNILIYGYLPVMLLGFIGMVRFNDSRNRIVWLMAVSYITIHIIITIFKLRYRLLIEPMLIIYSGILIERSWKSKFSGQAECDTSHHRLPDSI